MRLHVCGQFEARLMGLESGVTHMISIHGTISRLMTLVGLPRDNHLVMCFDDVTDIDDRAGPSRRHVEAVCAWVDQLPVEARLIIHCAQGISRSAAMALGLLARELPVEEAGAVLHSLRPMAQPNLRLAGLWDDHLGCGGQLKAVARRFPCRQWESAAA